MTKFKVGDKVMFKAYTCSIDTYSKFTELDLYQPQTVLNVEDGCLLLEENDGVWPSGLWERFEEWAKHQKAYPQDETLASLSQNQKAAPTEYSESSSAEYQLFAAKRLLSKAAQRLEDAHAYELAEEINKFLGKEE